MWIPYNYESDDKYIITSFYQKIKKWDIFINGENNIIINLFARKLIRKAKIECGIIIKFIILSIIYLIK
jgi:hypothetical protein